MGLFDFFRRKKQEKLNAQETEAQFVVEQEAEDPVDNGQEQKKADSASYSNVIIQTKQSSEVQPKQYSKCNCDGCINQESCKYGHVIYDEFDKTKLSLADKFMMLHTFDNFEPVGDYDDIATIEERHYQKKLIKLNRNRILKTLSYLQEQKKLYLAVGKCGKAYYNFMNMGGELQLVKNTLKEYDKLYKEGRC